MLFSCFIRLRWYRCTGLSSVSVNLLFPSGACSLVPLCVTLRRTLRNSAVKSTQTHLQPGKTRGFKPGLLTQAAVFPRLQADLEILGVPPVLVRAI
jgi:hypothetical protein